MTTTISSARSMSGRLGAGMFDRERMIGPRLIAGGWCLRRRCASICPSARLTASASSDCRCRGRSALPHPRPNDWTVPSSPGFSASRFFSSALRRRFSGAGWRGRAAQTCAALCLAGGFIVSAFGVWWHQLWLIYLGYGVIGGCGLGLGYISPVSTLVKWFPDRPGMATGMAIMGFGGGAFIGSNLSLLLMNTFKTATTTGVGKTFIALGIIYFCYMMFGSLIVRVPATDWKPARLHPAVPLARTDHVGTSPLTRPSGRRSSGCSGSCSAFNVTAGIGILEQASPMIQEMFPGKVAAAAAGGFVALLSLFNMGGRFIWSSLSDYTGRKAVYVIFLLLGAVLYCLIPLSGRSGSVIFFVLVCCIIISMYGGGFATVPAYLTTSSAP